MLGGTIVGYGKESTIVYTIDDIFEEIPNIQKICVFHRTDPLVTCHESLDLLSNRVEILAIDSLSDAALKNTGSLRSIQPTDMRHVAISLKHDPAKHDENDKSKKNDKNDKKNNNGESMTARLEAEIVMNNTIYDWFSRAGKLHLTSLHPMLSHLAVFYKPMGSAQLLKHILPVTLLKDCNLRELCLLNDVHIDDGLLLRVAERILQFLHVLHEKKYLHMDIKPENIFVGHTSDKREDPHKDFSSSSYRRRKTRSTSSKVNYSNIYDASTIPARVYDVVDQNQSHQSQSHQSQSQSQSRDADLGSNLEFILADYDHIAKANIVVGTTLSRRERFFKQGTDGFMSPLITKDYDDSENHAFPKFRNVAVHCNVTGRGTGFPCPPASMTYQQWGSYFAQRKAGLRKGYAYKIDMHSLALALLDVMPDVALPRTREVFRRTLKLVEHLMFFRDKVDVFTAQEGLRLVTALRSSVARSRRS
jgi:hypothetical protein